MHTYAHTHAHMHTYTHTHTFARAHAHTHTHIWVGIVEGRVGLVCVKRDGLVCLNDGGVDGWALSREGLLTLFLTAYSGSFSLSHELVNDLRLVLTNAHQKRIPQRHEHKDIAQRHRQAQRQRHRQASAKAYTRLIYVDTKT